MKWTIKRVCAYTALALYLSVMLACILMWPLLILDAIYERGPSNVVFWCLMVHTFVTIVDGYFLLVVSGYLFNGEEN